MDSYSPTDQEVLNTINRLLSNTDDDNTRKVFLRSMHAMANILNTMIDELTKIESINTAVGSELIALVVTEALNRGIDIPRV